ncbi:hypothetical protein MPSEU_000535800 [Mayamaea pseudoterrestris]|nr:hypothetical protein MPSEU_000535800 [Mayamaea pseudoterrestris]
MYTSRISPLHRLRRNKETPSSTISATSPKRKSMSVTPIVSPTSPRMCGDYQVLRKTVDASREELRESRRALASALDRLGEHHVRKNELDSAMDAFTEALHEKRSIFSIESGSKSANGSGYASSFRESDECSFELRDQAIDEVISTLRNMGNVHSLRGEQDEAMRYYTEVTNLKASKSVTVGNDEPTTLLSGFGEEDNSTLMSEINEDVKALDDMFRSISFRNHDNSTPMASRRQTKPLAAQAENTYPASSKRRKSAVAQGQGQGQGGATSYESEPFRRSASNACNFPASGNELIEALDLYTKVLDSYKGPLFEQHSESLNSLALRVDLLTDDLARSDSASNFCGNAMDLELTLEIFQHVLSVQHEMNESQGPRPDRQLSASIASTLIRMGSLYYKLGNRLEELRMYTEAKDTYCKAFGENSTFVAGARKNMGMVLAERGLYEESLAEFDMAKQIYLKTEGGTSMSRNVASAISCMGNVKNRIGELDQALEKYMEALSIYKHVQEEAVDKDSIAIACFEVTATLKVIGLVYSKKGDLDLAMSFFQEAMALLSTSGVDGTVTGCETKASILTRMASIYVKKGELNMAMEHYRDAYQVTVDNRGSTNHHEVAGILHHIGSVLHKKSEYDEAMDCYQEALRIYHTTVGPGNPIVAGTLVMIGSINYKKRNLDSAMMFYKEALRLNRDAYGMHHPDVAPILKSIGTILCKQHHYSEAYDVFRDVLSIKSTLHGALAYETASAYKSLGNVHYKLGELADAERQYRHALNIYRRTRGEEHPDTMAARTTIEHIRYWMKERGQRHVEGRHCRTTSRTQHDEDERSC